MLTKLDVKGSDMLMHFADLLNIYARTLTKLEGETLGIFRDIASDMRLAAVNVQMAEETKDDYLKELVRYHNQTSSLKYIIPGITNDDSIEEWD